MDKKKILIVDNEVNFTRLVKLNLEAAGQYEVKVENQGKRALQAARTFKPDLVFLDIVMPDLEGPEVARQIRADKELKSARIVFLTAAVTTEEVGISEGVIGGQAFLAKPVTVQQLAECVEKNLKK